MTIISLEEILTAVHQLPPADRQRLLNAIETMDDEHAPSPPRRSLLGLVADLGSAPSEEDIDIVRREVWGNFPRDDIE